MMGLKPDAVMINDADNGYRNIETSRSKSGDAVKRTIWWRVQYVVAPHGSQTLKGVFRNDVRIEDVHRGPLTERMRTVRLPRKKVESYISQPSRNKRWTTRQRLSQATILALQAPSSSNGVRKIKLRLRRFPGPLWVNRVVLGSADYFRSSAANGHRLNRR